VMISGILILKYTDTGETEKVREINFWSIRIIPQSHYPVPYRICFPSWVMRQKSI